jgi:hypothetical protein
MKLSLTTWSVLAMSTLSVLPAAAQGDRVAASEEPARTAFVQMSAERRLDGAVVRTRSEPRAGSGERSAAPPHAEKAVVEPSTLGLMLTGLALIGLMLLRRRHD